MCVGECSKVDEQDTSLLQNNKGRQVWIVLWHFDTATENLILKQRTFYYLTLLVILLFII